MPINFPSDTTQPWYNTDNGITYVYANDAWRSTSASVNLNAHYVEVAGDTMTGGLSFRDTDGSVKTTLFTNGSAEFAGDVTIGEDSGANLQIYQYDPSENVNGIQVGSGPFSSVLTIQNQTLVPTTTEVFRIMRGTNVTASITPIGNINTGTIDISKNTGLGCEIRSDGLVRAQRATGSSGSAVFQAWNGNFNSAFITAGGSAEFKGNGKWGYYNSGDTNSGGVVIKTDGQLVVQGRAGSKETPRVAIQGYQTDVDGKMSSDTWDIKTNGTASLTLVRSAGFIIETERDNDDNYTTTTEEYIETESYTGPLGNTLEHEVTKTRDIRTYTGPTLDVKERLTKADNALIALKSAAAATTDFAELKAAIATALADI